MASRIACVVFCCCLALSAGQKEEDDGMAKLNLPWRILKPHSSANPDTIKFLTERGQVDRYMLVKITVQGEEGAVLTLTDNSTWAVPGSEEVAKPENPEGLSNPENPSPTLAELHEKIQSMGFIEKTAEDLKADHDRQFAKFKKKVHWYYEKSAPEKLKDSAFTAKLDKLMRAHFKTLRDESAFMQEIRYKYPDHTGKEEGLLHHEL